MRDNSYNICICYEETQNESRKIAGAKITFPTATSLRHYTPCSAFRGETEYYIHYVTLYLFSSEVLSKLFLTTIKIK